MDGRKSTALRLVFTKVDKLNQAEHAGFLLRYEVEMLKQWHRMYVTSSEKGEGREELLRFIEQTNALYEA